MINNKAMTETFLLAKWSWSWDAVFNVCKLHDEATTVLSMLMQHRLAHQDQFVHSVPQRSWLSSPGVSLYVAHCQYATPGHAETMH